MDSKYVTNTELMSGIAWHLECIDLARQKIDNFRASADSFQMRMYYSLYVTNLMSAIDIVLEIHKGDFQTALEERLKTSHHSGANVLGYVRELRNGIVHRGLDPIKGGSVHNDIVYAIAQPVTNRSGAQIYSEPAKLLRDILLHTDISARPIIEYFLEPTFAEVLSISSEAIMEDTLKAVDETTHIPELSRKIVRSNISSEMLETIRTSQISKWRRLLQPPTGQRIT